MRNMLAMALFLMAAPAEAETQGPEKMALSMQALLGGEAGTMADCRLSAGLCAHVEKLEALRKAEPSLIRGGFRILPNTKVPQLLAVARRLPEGNRAPFVETIILFNNSSRPVAATVMVDAKIDVTKSLLGCCAMPSPGGLLEVVLQPFETQVCAGAVAVN